MKTKSVRIKSAAQAFELHDKLESYWSKESRLSQKILIYIAELLEAKKPKKRKPSKWQAHVARYLRQGKTIQQAAKDWKK